MKASVGKAAAYAVVAFQTAYLMHYYPTEFIAAMLNSVMGNNEKVAFYIRFAGELGIQVLPPDINESYAKFTVKENKIRFGMAAVKNVGVNVIHSIVKSREKKGKFKSLSDFYSKIDTTQVNKRAIESLIKAGAFDSFKVFRSKMLAVYEKMLEGMQSERKRNIEGQISLFADFQESFGDIEVKYPDIKEFEKKYLLAMEKEMTGIYLSGHPLEEYEETLKNYTDTKTTDLLMGESLEDEMIAVESKLKDGDRVVIGGIIAEVNRKVTRNNDFMAFIRLEDLYGSVEVVIFPKTYENCKSYINEDSIVVLKGRISIKEEEQPKILCENMEPLLKMSSEKVYILVEEDKQVKGAMEQLKPILSEYEGSIPVYLCTKKERKKYRLDREYWVDSDTELFGELRKRFGEDCVKVI